MENFAKLSKMSRETGLDFQKLAGSFGDSMDTFEGAAQMAGGLNQILGGSVFNSVELSPWTKQQEHKPSNKKFRNE